MSSSWRAAAAVLAILMSLAPGALGSIVPALPDPPSVAPPPAPLAAASVADLRATVQALASRLAPHDGGALRDVVLPLLDDRPGMPPLRLPVPRALAATSTLDDGDALAEEAPTHVWSGETVWINDTVVKASWIAVAEGGRLIVQNATILLGDGEWSGGLWVAPSGTLVLNDSTVAPFGSFEWPPYVGALGSLDASRATFDRVQVWTRPDAPGTDASAIRRSVFAGATLRTEEDSLVEESLFYNATQALTLGANATARRNTLVNNEVGVALEGEGARLEGNVIRFNQMGVAWRGVPGVTLRGNNLHDNYQDAVFGASTEGVTLDVSGNWWDGVPNVDGDSYGGAGVSASSHAASRFPAPDRSGELPFRLHVMRGDVTWTGPAVLDGPVIARGGTLTFRDVEVDGNGFRVGSHVGARLHVERATFRGVPYLFSRSDDVFDRLTMQGTTGGVLAIGGSPTVRDGRFVDVALGVGAAPRALGEPAGKLLVERCVFERAEVGVVGALAQVTLRGNTITGSAIGVLSALNPAASMEDTLVSASAVGVVSVLDQGFSMSRDGVYNTAIGVLAGLTPSVTVRGLETRYGALAVVAAGSPVNLVGSNVYDNPVFGLYAVGLTYADAQTGQEVSAAGSIVVDATTHVGDPTRGDVRYLPPRKSSPSATPGRADPYAPTVVGAGQTLLLDGQRVLGGPLVVRGGGSLLVERADVDAAGHSIVAHPGSTVEIRNATIRHAAGVHLHAARPRIVDAAFPAPAPDAVASSGAVLGVTIVEANAAEVRRSIFAGVGLELWDAKAEVTRSLFRDATLSITNETWPRAGSALVRENVFAGDATAVRAKGNPVAELRSNSFDVPTAVDAAGGSLRAPPTGGGRVDARHNWFGDPEGPQTPGNWSSNGASVWWSPEGAPTVLYEPWRDTPFRAAFEPSRLVATDLEEVRFRNDSFNLDDGIRGQSWSFGDGSAGSAESDPSHVFQRHGANVVRLEVLDDLGRVSVAERTILVKATPVARLEGPASTLTLVDQTFDAGASTDADGLVAAWRFETSDGRDTGFAPSPTLAHAFARPGEHWVRVTARDDEGLAGAPALLQVLVENRAPVAAFSVAPDAPTRADVVELRSLSEDLDGGVASLAWDLGDGSNPSLGEVVHHRFAEIGSYEVALRVTDDLGATSVATRVVHVTNAPPVAAFAFTPLQPEPGDVVRFGSASHDPDGTTLAHAWDLGDGATAEGPTAEHAFNGEGDFVVRLAVTDADGATATVGQVVRVRWNVPPVAAFDAAADSVDDATWRFQDLSADPDGLVVARLWDFGDGSASADEAPTRRYLDAGETTVRLAVTDDRGATGAAERRIVVDDTLAATGKVAPVARAQEEIVLALRSTWLNGTGAPAYYSLRVVQMDPLAPDEPWRTIAASVGRTGADGRISYAAPKDAGVAHLPGEYRALVTFVTWGGVGGNREEASLALNWRVEAA